MAEPQEGWPGNKPTAGTGRTGQASREGPRVHSSPSDTGSRAGDSGTHGQNTPDAQVQTHSGHVHAAGRRADG